MDVASGKVTLNSAEAVAGMKLLGQPDPGRRRIESLPSQGNWLEDFPGRQNRHELRQPYWQLEYPTAAPKSILMLRSFRQGLNSSAAVSRPWMVGQSTDTKSPEAAWEAMKYIVSYNSELQYYTSVGPVTRKDVMAEIVKTPVAQRTRAPRNLGIGSSRLWARKASGCYCPASLGFVDATQNHVQPVINVILEGGKTVDDGMAEATKAAQDYLDSTYPDLKSSTC